MKSSGKFDVSAPRRIPCGNRGDVERMKSGLVENCQLVDNQASTRSQPSTELLFMVWDRSGSLRHQFTYQNEYLPASCGPGRCAGKAPSLVAFSREIGGFSYANHSSASYWPAQLAAPLSTSLLNFLRMFATFPHILQSKSNHLGAGENSITTQSQF